MSYECVVYRSPDFVTSCNKEVWVDEGVLKRPSGELSKIRLCGGMLFTIRYDGYLSRCKSSIERPYIEFLINRSIEDELSE